MVMLSYHRVVARYPFPKQEHTDLAFINQPLQVPVDRTKTDARKRSAYSLVDLVCAGMRVISPQSGIDCG